MTFRLLTCAVRTAFLDLLNQALKIGIAGAEFLCEPVSAALRNPLAVRDHLKLASLTGPEDGLDAEALLDEGHETRDLDLIVLSRRAVNDFDLHPVLRSAQARA
jgi:hypothetical protein